jgi:hypothetical protein
MQVNFSEPVNSHIVQLQRKLQAFHQIIDIFLEINQPINMRSLIIFLCFCSSMQSYAQKISISEANPRFWSLDGKPTLLLGGSVEDNLFQILDLEKQLALLSAAGGNYVRCTMSSRDAGNEWPFAKNQDGLYDLRQFNEAYWARFENFLKLTAEKNIVVQIEVWATFDFYRDIWDINPFNPKNNVSYDSRRSKLSETVDSHPIYTENNFFRSVPSQMSLFVVLEYQQKFVDKLLEHSLQYDHVLYCMDNETSVTADWGAFWSDYIKKVAAEKYGKQVYTTEMWDPWDLDHIAHRSTIDHPEMYDFVDISQNNHHKGQVHWDNGLRQIRRIHQSAVPRPVNNVKVYGADGNKFGHDNQDGIERFVRNVLLGAASTRFHRPDSGLGLSDTAQLVISKLRYATRQYPHFEAVSCNEMLSDKEENEAYVRGKVGEAFLLFLPFGGAVKIDLTSLGNEAEIEWIPLLEQDVPIKTTSIQTTNQTTISAPSSGNYLAIIRKKQG